MSLEFILALENGNLKAIEQQLRACTDDVSRLQLLSYRLEENNEKGDHYTGYSPIFAIIRGIYNSIANQTIYPLDPIVNILNMGVDVNVIWPAFKKNPLEIALATQELINRNYPGHQHQMSSFIEYLKAKLTSPVPAQVTEPTELVFAPAPSPSSQGSAAFMAPFSSDSCISLNHGDRYDDRKSSPSPSASTSSHILLFDAPKITTNNFTVTLAPFTGPTAPAPIVSPTSTLFAFASEANPIETLSSDATLTPALESATTSTNNLAPIVATTLESTATTAANTLIIMPEQELKSTPFTTSTSTSAITPTSDTVVPLTSTTSVSSTASISVRHISTHTILIQVQPCRPSNDEIKPEPNNEIASAPHISNPSNISGLLTRQGMHAPDPTQRNGASAFDPTHNNQDAKCCIIL